MPPPPSFPPSFPPSTPPPAPPALARRRVLLAGGAITAVGGLAGWWRTLGATVDREPADGRPLLRGRAPAIFVGHGSPMNALQDNDFTRSLRAWGRAIGQPRAILVVSAHWLSERQVQVSVTDHPETIHDFGGFPPALHRARYPAPGAPAAAERAALRLAPQRVARDAQRGLDHGAWTVLHHLYPAADVPVAQLSIDITRGAPFHLGLGRALAALRDEGVLIVGSGNVVHNLGETLPDAAASARGLTPWADDFDQRVRQALDAGDTAALLRYEALGPGAALAVPFQDHYLPLLYALGAAQADERPRHVFEGFQAGTLSMRCVQWG